MLMIPVQLILLSIPTAVYVVWQRKRLGTREALHRMGFQGAEPRFYLIALAYAVLFFVASAILFPLIPEEAFAHPNVSFAVLNPDQPLLSALLGALAYQAFYIALGEEIFFRGFLGGLLFPRLPFLLANTIQALAFLLPHLLLLAVTLSFWPIVLVQFAAGWFIGLLRYRSGSILPGWLMHSLANMAPVFLLGA